MNNNKLDENALLAGGKGVFSKTSYITIGSKERPEDYVKKTGNRSVYAGKQFAVIPPKDGRTVDVYFEKKHNWIGDGAKYVDKIRYKDTQAEKKRGFLTSDFSKRDEFSNTIRTEQWREQLSQEHKYSKKALDMFSSSAGALMTSTAQQQAAQDEEDQTLLYDLVYEKDDPHFSGASRTHRDTKNRTWLSYDRTLGGHMTTTCLAFQPPEEFNKPEHARKPLVRDTFYRKTNIMFPDGCAATSGN